METLDRSMELGSYRMFRKRLLLKYWMWLYAIIVNAVCFHMITSHKSMLETVVLIFSDVFSLFSFFL